MLVVSKSGISRNINPLRLEEYKAKGFVPVKVPDNAVSVEVPDNAVSVEGPTDELTVEPREDPALAETSEPVLKKYKK